MQRGVAGGTPSRYSVTPSVLPLALLLSTFGNAFSREFIPRLCLPTAGDAVIFYNLAGMHVKTGAVDTSSWHSGCKVRGEGKKRAVNMWFFTGLPEK